MDKQQLKQLQEFVQICKSKPEVLHLPELGFYRQWLERYVIRCKVYIYATSVVDQWFLVNVNSSSGSLYVVVRPSVCLSVVCL